MWEASEGGRWIYDFRICRKKRRVIRRIDRRGASVGSVKAATLMEV